MKVLSELSLSENYSCFFFRLSSKMRFAVIPGFQASELAKSMKSLYHTDRVF